ncbi:hypothetical protein AAHE18_17G164400 [Arachis hypogaea]
MEDAGFWKKLIEKGKGGGSSSATTESPLSRAIFATEHLVTQRGKTDPAWGHCKQVLDKGKTTLVYIYCEKHIKGGGINRVKHHLAGKGGDIEACRKVPAAVRHQFSQNIEDLQTKKRKTQEEYAESYATPSAQPSIKSVLQSKEIVEKCDIAIARWMMDASVPFNAVNSAYYQPMIDAIANMGVGYKGPNYQRVRGYLLSKLVEDVKKMIEDWSPCAAHCINLMLQDIGKFVEVTETVSQASMITKYIYNHCHPLYLMRQFTGGREILRPAPTRLATNFIALQTYSKEAKAKKFVDQVLDSKFWNQCTDIVKLTEPLVHVLRIMDSEDRAAMGFLYQAMYKAREDMVKRFQKRKRVVEPYLKILDSRWDLQLKRNLHAAGYWLNPAFRFNSAEFDKHKETISGLLDVIERYAYGNADLITKLTSEKRIFKNAEGYFGRQSAIRERSTVMPDQWWESYGCGVLNLQKLAIRVLSQTCSSSGCERNWSIFEHIHSKKRNRLEHQKLNDLVYVHYNLRLQQRYFLLFFLEGII